MSEEVKKMSSKTLLIGCGGSGIKTLIRLNELMSSNADIREDMAENISYFVLDTDAGDLNNFENMIHMQMGFSTAPFVAKAHLTDGINQLNEIVSPSFDDKPDEVSAEMKKYWWHSEEGVPFRGEDITDLQLGAAQCCQVSYLATWNYMSKIEETIKTILQEIAARNKTQANPLANLRVYILAGIAGGTGRGSWTLVAFKVRESLLRHGVDVPINGVFFDATCYPNVTGDAEQRKSMFVNSATAISELSSWIRLKKSGNLDNDNVWKSAYFSLPSLSNPLNASAIDFNDFVETKDTSLLAPIQAAYVVFGENGSTAPLQDNMQYHNMAAAALYAMIVNADDIGSKKSNMRSNIGSFASTTFEVDSFRIQTYLETAVQKAFLEKQCAEADPELVQQVKEAVGTFQNPAKDSFLGKNHLWIPAEPAFDESVNSMNDETTLLETVMQALQKKESNLTSSKNEEANVTELGITSKLREALATQDVDEVKNKVESVLLMQDLLSDSTVKQVLNQILAENNLDGENLTKTLRDLIMDQFAPEGEPVSLRRAMLFADELHNAFSQYSQILNGSVKVEAEFCQDVGKLIETFKTDVEAKSGKTLKEKLLIVSDPFNKGEIEDLARRFQYFVPAAVFFRVRDVLAGFYKESLKVLDRIRSSMEKMSEYLMTASKKLDGNVTKVFGDKSFDDIFDELFSDSDDPDSILKSIPRSRDLRSLYYRNLKPILSRGELNAMLTNRENFWEERKQIMACIQKELDNLLDISCKVKGRKYDTEEDAKDEIPKKVCEVVAAHVGLKGDNSGRSFTNRYFSFEEVLNTNRKAWEKLLRETSRGRVGDLYDQFREYLGVETSDFVKDDNGLPTKFNMDTLVKRMILSLLTTCNPWIELKPQREVKQPLSCLVVLPLDISSIENDVRKEIQNRFSSLNYNLSLEILHGGSKTSKRIPQDRILVFNAELLSSQDNGDVDGAPVENILSVDYWKDYSEILKLAEDSNHDSAALFTKSARYGGRWVERPRGFAYLAPFFTMDPFRTLRWRPWSPDDTSKEKERLEEVYKVLFYSFLGYGRDEKIAGTKELLKDSYGCEMPLLQMGKGSHSECFVFLREPQVWNGEKMDEVIAPAWHKGDELENSINHVVEFLDEQGHASYRSEGGAKLQRSIEDGRKKRLALLKEADSFFGIIPNKIGEDKYKVLVRECCAWIFSKLESSQQEDKPYWQSLYDFAQNWLDKLG